MIKTSSKQVEVDVLEDVICDVCNNSCKNSTNFEYMTMKNYWGYGSSKDGQLWGAHICEKCVDEKFKFVKFRRQDYMIGESRVCGLESKIVNAGSVIIQL